MREGDGSREVSSSSEKDLLLDRLEGPAGLLSSSGPNGRIPPRFRIRRQLGEGGMGVVYEAFDEERKALVALKLLNRFDPGALVRFKREFRALQELPHPNLVALNELFCANDEWFFTMELLDGVDFVSWVRGTPPKLAYASTVRESAGKLPGDPPSGGVVEAQDGSAFDEQKLREGLRQLLEALAVLHLADKVHRDVKPSNILVTRDGRVVLLDFGLVTEASIEDRTTGSALVGTPSHMAPEQAASRGVGPPADLYAAGVVLYEALTGRLPIDGPKLQVLIAKQSIVPEAPSTLARGIPSDLEALCLKLLHVDPALRPTAQEALRVLAAPFLAATPADRRRTSTESATFVGRAMELAMLREAYDVCRAGRLSTVLVSGESGIGKSYLVRRFTAQLQSDEPEAMLFEGRCYERESVPYKTLDGVVDALASRLARLSASEVEALLPARSAMLAQVFPSLLRVEQIAREHAATELIVDRYEYRRRAFAALRDLVTRIALRRPTVIVVDDLQWADDDGLKALAEVLRQPEAPPLLLIGTVRVTRGEHEATLARLQALMPGETRALALANLPHEEARQLAALLLRRIGNAEVDPERLATEAHGHPLFVEELARHLSLGDAETKDLKLDDAIWSRITRLDAKARAIAELVALAGKPVPQEVVALATHTEAGEFGRRAAILRASLLVRTGGARWADAIEPYHDRVREAVVGRLEPSRRRALHEAIALAFESSSHHDAEALASHWREAGNRLHTSKYARIAGDQAAKAFAFDRAARWYEEALALLPEGEPARRQLQIKLGDALGNAGRGALAARHLEDAAVGSPPGEALELRRRAANQLLRSGHLDEGTRAMRAVLAANGMHLPGSWWTTLGLLLLYRALLRVRGLHFREQEKTSIASNKLTRVDTCLAMATTFAMVDAAVGMVFATRALLLALEVGEIERLACSFGLEAALRGGTGGRTSWREADALLRIGRPLAEKSGGATPLTFIGTGLGSALWGSGRFREAVDEFEKVLEINKSGAPGLVFESTSVRQLMMIALLLLGRYKAIRALQREALRDALDRNDKYASTQMRTGSAVLAWLAQDTPAVVEENARAAFDDWSKQGFHLEHVDVWFGRIYAALYSGNSETAFEASGYVLARARRALFWRLQSVRVRARHLRGTSALADARRGDRALALREAKRQARALDREDLPWIRPSGASLRAGIAFQEGAQDEALSHLDTAARDFDAHDLLGYAAAARYHAANLRADALERERALDYFRSQDVARPERMIRMLVAGFPEP